MNAPHIRKTLIKRPRLERRLGNAASLVVGGVILASILISGFLLLSDHYAIGITDTSTLHEHDGQVGVELLFLGHRQPITILPGPYSEQKLKLANLWILARGKPTPTPLRKGERELIVEFDNWRSLPVPLKRSLIQHSAPEMAPWLALPLAFLLVLGAFVLRALGAMAVGVLAALLAWHVLALTHQHQLMAGDFYLVHAAAAMAGLAVWMLAYFVRHPSPHRINPAATIVRRLPGLILIAACHGLVIDAIPWEYIDQAGIPGSHHVSAALKFVFIFVLPIIVASYSFALLSSVLVLDGLMLSPVLFPLVLVVLCAVCYAADSVAKYPQSNFYFKRHRQYAHTGRVHIEEFGRTGAS